MSGPRPTFAGYQLLDVITTDTVSTVYRAARTTGAAPVALRVTHAVDTQNDGERITAFLRRVSAAAGLTHPAVVPTLDMGEAEGRAYVATALATGPPLGDLLLSRGPLPPTTAFPLLRDIAAGLDAAHAEHVIHGAISPRTIWLTSQTNGDQAYRAVITGFGLDTLLRQQPRATRDRAASDDLLYVAPEQLRGRHSDGRADQYALACALYHCVAGQPPFVRETAAALFGAHLFAQPSQQVPALQDPRLRRAVLRGMTKQPDDRYPSCRHLLQDAGQPAPATRASSVAATAAAPPQTPAVRPSPAEDAPPALSDNLQRPLPRGPAQRRRSGWRDTWWFPWPAVALLAGVIVTLALAALLRDDNAPQTPVAGAVEQSTGRPGAADTAAANDNRRPQTEIVWERTIGQEAVVELAEAGDTLVAATDNGVVTLDAEQGAPRWQGEVDVGILTDMLATDELVVYRASSLRALSIGAGQQQWDNSTALAPTGSLAASSDVIYGIGPGRIVPELMAVDPDTGEELWHFHGEEVTVDQRAAVAPTDDLVAILQDGSLFGLDPHGELASSGEDRVEVDTESWRTDVPDPWVQTLVLPPDGAVLFATQTGEVCAHDPADGTESWCTQIDALRDVEPRVLASDATTVVVVTPRQVIALDQATGQQRWSFEPPQPLTAAAAATQRDVIVVDRRGRAQALALASGEPRWRSPRLGDVTAVVASADDLYVGTEDGSVICVRPTVAAG